MYWPFTTPGNPPGRPNADDRPSGFSAGRPIPCRPRIDHPRAGKRSPRFPSTGYGRPAARRPRRPAVCRRSFRTWTNVGAAMRRRTDRRSPGRPQMNGILIGPRESEDLLMKSGRLLTAASKIGPHLTCLSNLTPIPGDPATRSPVMPARPDGHRKPQVRAVKEVRKISSVNITEPVHTALHTAGHSHVDRPRLMRHPTSSSAKRGHREKLEYD